MMNSFSVGRASMVAALLASGALFATQAIAQPAQSTLRIRLNADIRSTDPGVNRDANTDAVMAHLVEGLVAFREDTSVAPMLARSVTASPDGKVYTFALRDGVKFSNGMPLTADDVVFAWNRYMTPATGWRCLTEFDGRGAAHVLKAEAKDKSTVVFTLEKPSALFLTTMARPDCGGTGIYHRSSLDADGKWREPIGTGPFRMSEWRRGQFVELARFDGYAALAGPRDGNAGNKTAEVAKVRFVIIPDPSSAKAALLSGAIDVNFDLDDEDIGELAKVKGLQIDSAPTMGLNGLLLQTRDPVLKDVRVRRALALSIDLPQLVESVANARTKPNRSAIPPPSTYYGKAQAEIPPRDLATARKLLAEAGYKGQPIKILANKRYNALFNMAVLVQAMAAEAGIKVEVEVLDWATQLDRYNKGDYQAMAFAYSARFDPSLSYEMIAGPKDKQPRKVWDSPEPLSWLASSAETTEKAQRQALFDRLDARLREEVPAVFFYSEVRTSAARAEVKGYKGWALGQPRAWGVSFNAR